MIQNFEISSNCLIEQVKQTKLLGSGDLAYEGAEVSLVRVSPKEVFPTALYVLRPNLEVIHQIRLNLFDLDGVDILQLDNIHEFRDGVISPPVVEICDGVPAIVDGIHRFFYAMLIERPVNCILVENVKFPLISIPVTWDQVHVYNTKPEDPKKLRVLRSGISDNSQSLRRFYRDFSFLGSQGRRPRKGQEA